ncbi:hypothetical protein [Actinoplanes sp. TFC3]|uniref:hypothetical protein n=1 Tax=Actinoplanes sp. TFC3 TaxID=1710355 RepID=UPI00082954A4|nr:hypothetical protein [Actinoplanes sp. TFC3]
MTSATVQQLAAADTRIRSGELFVVPVTITPTKPLTPTHVKGLLWTDILVRATARILPVTLVWNPRMANLTTQTTAFWHYLDASEPGTNWSQATEGEIGLRYVRFHAEGQPPHPRELDPYFERVEREGWIHPAARRLLELWTAQLNHLGVTDPGLTAVRPLACGEDELLDRLREHDLLVDHARYGGPVYLDGPRWGLPLRQVVGADAHANYLVPILRDLLPAIQPGRTFLLLYDDGLNPDYVLLERVLQEFGADVSRLPLSRVPIDGAVRSSRYGGWTGSTLGDLTGLFGDVEARTYRLGMRLYFAGTLHRGSPQSFDVAMLRRCMTRAQRILGQAPDNGSQDADLRLLNRCLGRDHTHVDPYRLTTTLLGKRAEPLHPWLAGIYN